MFILSKDHSEVCCLSVDIKLTADLNFYPSPKANSIYAFSCYTVVWNNRRVTVPLDDTVTG